MSTIFLRLLVVLIGCSTLMTYANLGTQQIPIELPVNLTEDPLTADDQAKIAQITTAMRATEWLGPLAPIAISPFFGITILAGISQFGGDALPFNSFISDNPVLGNPAVFWVFLALTVITSLPKFTKVSKPAAQAIDKLEAYAGIITIVLIRFLTMIPESDPSTQTAMVVQMGIFTFTADVLLSIAAIINIIVINTVKFFFEMMVWLIPFPFVDAMLEVANKSICAGLMAIYAWSPTVATLLNLALFVACLFVFRWIHRQSVYFRALLFDPAWATINKSFGVPNRKELVVFPRHDLGPFQSKTTLLLQPTENGWRLTQARWFLPQKTLELAKSVESLTLQKGVFINSLKLTGPVENELLFSRRYSDHLEKVAELIGAEMGGEETPASAKLEFS